MSRNPSLRSRIVVGVVCFTAFVSLTITLLGYWVNEQAEQRVWESMFQSDLGQRFLGGPEQATSTPETGSLREFGGQTGKSVPEEFANLAPGVHDEVRLGDRLYVVAVERSAEQLAVLALDISEMEKKESRLAFAIVAGGILAVLLLAGVTYVGAQWLLRPLTDLSGTIKGLKPGVRGQQVGTEPSDPSEVAVISTALNQYLRDIDSYVDRERQFLNLASHELRTPIAVISGAAEVAIEQPTIEQSRTHVARILRASRGMQELAALLLALARDPARLRAGAAQIDLAALIPRLVADHQHMLQGKGLAITFRRTTTTELLVPEVIAAAAIGNLIRNAIENSSHGEIVISLDSRGTLAIDDPGSDMSPEERKELHARLARAGYGQAGGIGLDLVHRLCEHLGWALRLGPLASGGTRAELAFTAPA